MSTIQPLPGKKRINRRWTPQDDMRLVRALASDPSLVHQLVYRPSDGQNSDNESDSRMIQAAEASADAEGLNDSTRPSKRARVLATSAQYKSSNRSMYHQLGELVSGTEVPFSATAVRSRITTLKKWYKKWYKLFTLQGTTTAGDASTSHSTGLAKQPSSMASAASADPHEHAAAQHSPGQPPASASGSASKSCAANWVSEMEEKPIPIWFDTWHEHIASQLDAAALERELVMPEPGAESDGDPGGGSVGGGSKGKKSSSGMTQRHYHNDLAGSPTQRFLHTSSAGRAPPPHPSHEDPNRYDPSRPLRLRPYEHGAPPPLGGRHQQPRDAPLHATAHLSHPTSEYNNKTLSHHYTRSTSHGSGSGGTGSLPSLVVPNQSHNYASSHHSHLPDPNSYRSHPHQTSSHAHRYPRPEHDEFAPEYGHAPFDYRSTSDFTPLLPAPTIVDVPPPAAPVAPGGFSAYLVAAEPEGYTSCIAHPFLTTAATRGLAPEEIESWLSQDRLYASAGYLRFTGLMLARLPNPSDHGCALPTSVMARCRAVLSGAISNVVREVQFFEDTAAYWSLGLDRGSNQPVSVLAPITKAYCEFMTAVGETGSLEEHMTLLWAIEKLYLESWTIAANGQQSTSLAPPRGNEVSHADQVLDLFVQNWTCDPFRAYVVELGSLLDEIVPHDTAPHLVKARCQEVWRQALMYGRYFWDAGRPAVHDR